MSLDMREEFFEWIYQVVEGKGYRRVLEELFNTEFYPVIDLDENRIYDGVNLRYKFAEDCNYLISEIDEKFDPRHCNILEMMLGLAFRVEETIMSDEDYGDRTTMWFWIMMKSLGLYDMNDSNFDYDLVNDIIIDFLDRNYRSNGEGSLFVVHDSDKDMRDVEIWYQMCKFFEKLL